MKTRRYAQSGSVSLFVVIFSALLIITIGTAFIRIMMQDQMQATSDDLSKSALDSAYAGVEDAKRAIAYYENNCPNNTDSLCNALDTNWSANNCREVPLELASRIGGMVVGDDGVFVQANGHSNDLNQAYTCLKVQMKPDSDVGDIQPDKSRIIKLQSDAGDPQKITIEWYPKTGSTPDVDTTSIATPYVLPQTWPSNRPPIIKAQLIQYPSAGITLSDFDDSQLYNATLYLLPSDSTHGSSTADFTTDTRLSQSKVPVRARCDNTSGNYACKINITLPTFSPGNPRSGVGGAYLKLTTFYSGRSEPVSVTMYDATSPTPLPFTGVQAVVDSTGRADNLFRRIQSRVDIGVDSIPNPEAAIDTTKSLCKEFAVTDNSIVPGLDMNDIKCPKLP